MQDDNKQSQDNSVTPEEDNVFIANPEPPKEATKNIITKEIIAAISFLLLVLLITTAWLYNSANSAGSSYLGATQKQLAQVKDPLTVLTPGAVLNNRNLDVTLETITELKQPQLDSVFFASVLSPEYQQAQEKRAEVEEYYKKLTRYAEDISKLVSFSSEMKIVQSDMANSRTNTQTNNSSSLRALSGAMENYQQRILAIEAPQQLKNLQEQVADIYAQQSGSYDSWALAFDEKQPEEIVGIEAKIRENDIKIEKLTTDENYINQFESTHKKLIEKQIVLQKRFSS